MAAKEQGSHMSSHRVILVRLEEQELHHRSVMAKIFSLAIKKSSVPQQHLRTSTGLSLHIVLHTSQEGPVCQKSSRGTQLLKCPRRRCLVPMVTPNLQEAATGLQLSQF